MNASDLRLIEQAAERWGLRKPSPDDILSPRWPLYNEDHIHTAGYHQMMEAACDLATEPRTCVRCGGPILEGNANKLYCSDRCHHEPVEDPHPSMPPRQKASEKSKRLVAELFGSMIDEDAA